MTRSSLIRLMQPLANKIFLAIGRGVLKAVNNAESTQKLQVELLADEIRSGVERFQEYGFESHPLSGAEVLALFLNGNRSQGIITKVHDRRHRPTGMQAGEVKVYTDEGDEIYFKRGSEILIKSNAKVRVEAPDIEAVATVKVKAEAPEIEAVATVKVKLDAPLTEVTGALVVAGAATVGAGLGVTGAVVASGAVGGLTIADASSDLQTMRNTYNVHTHPESGGGTTSAPNPPPM